MGLQPVPATVVEPGGGRPCGVETLVVIVNYRTGPLVVDCLRSLASEPDVREGRACVVVVDNASGDGSAARIRQAIETNGWQAWVSVLESERNGGFAYGNNLAVRAALQSGRPPAYFWLLNPDTVVRPGALGHLVQFMREHPGAGIAGGGIDEGDGRAWPYAFRFPSVWSELENSLRLGLASRLLSRHAVARRMGDRPEEVEWVSGATMMVRREVFEAIGLMDEGYFLYFEETDFCLRAARAGWLCWHVPQSRVMHIAGQSTGMTGRLAVVPRRPAYWFESRRRYFVKNHGWAYGALADVVWILGFASWRVRRWMLGKEDTDPPRMLLDFIQHSVLWQPGLWRARRGGPVKERAARS